MKKFTIIAFILFTSFSLWSQKKDALKIPKNEIKLNTFSLIGFGAFDLSYEYLINEESSFGISLYINANDNYEEMDLFRTFSLTPYYRVYFSKKYNKGFFVEGFSSLYTGKEYSYYSDYDYATDGSYKYSYTESYKEYKGLALGISVGGKWVTKRGFVAEISAGIGRNIYGGIEDLPIVGRGGITLGKRF